MPKIKEITAEQTLHIRHKVMWPTQSVDFVKLHNDEAGKHFGLFLEEELIAVVSLFITDETVQFRKFATLEEHQEKGYGSLLLKEVFQIASKENISRIWCNARVNKANYYSKFGMQETKTTFTKSGVDYVIMERIFTTQPSKC